MNRPSEGDLIGASANLSKGLLAYLTGLVSRGAKGTEGISLLGIEESGQVAHVHSLFCVSAGDYTEMDLWGVLGLLPDKGVPAHIKITPIHLAASYFFLGVSRTEFDSALAGLSTEDEDFDDLAQEPAAGADDGFRRICSRGACFIP